MITPSSKMQARSGNISRRSPKRLLCTLLLTNIIIRALALECPPGQERTADKACSPCKAGTYNALPNSTCTPCVAGTFTPFTGVTHASLCTPCAANATSPLGSADCTPCPPGQISSGNRCVRCAPGTHVREGRCRKCARGLVSTEFNARACSECPSALFADDSSSSCIERPCIPGRVWSSKRKSCRKCPKNSHRTAEMSECQECPTRRTALRSRAEKTKCRKCPPGTFITEVFEKLSRSGVRTCRVCAEGTTTNGFSKPVCRVIGTACTQGLFEDVDGDCNFCDVGSRYVPAKKWCARCRDGEAGAGGMSTVCRKCPVNMLAVGGRCACKPGFFFSAGRCRPCAAGSARGSHERPGCTLCTAGTQASGRGASECEECPPGWTSWSTRGAECVPPPVCEEGFVIPVTDSPYRRIDVCVSGVTGCPTGTERVLTSGRIVCRDVATAKVLCPPGSLFNGNEGNGACLRCARGEMLQRNEDGFWTCAACPEGLVSGGGLSRLCRACGNGFEADSDLFRCDCPIGKYIVDGVCQSCPEDGEENLPRADFCVLDPYGLLLNYVEVVS